MRLRGDFQKIIVFNHFYIVLLCLGSIYMGLVYLASDPLAVFGLIAGVVALALLAFNIKRYGLKSMEENALSIGQALVFASFFLLVIAIVILEAFKTQYSVAASGQILQIVFLAVFALVVVGLLVPEKIIVRGEKL